ncbi:MAG: hypothetical protein ACI9EW_003471 [Cellvibrionaceae bacterium]|jgi:hypothetical protein
MQKALKILLAIVGGFITLILTFMLYWTIAPSIIGPKAEVKNFCSAIEPGTTTAELREISGIHGLSPIDGTHDNGTVQVGLQLQNGWICICQVEIENGAVVQPNDVFCSD